MWGPSMCLSAVFPITSNLTPNFKGKIDLNHNIGPLDVMFCTLEFCSKHFILENETWLFLTEKLPNILVNTYIPGLLPVSPGQIPKAEGHLRNPLGPLPDDDLPVHLLAKDVLPGEELKEEESTRKQRKKSLRGSISKRLFSILSICVCKMMKTLFKKF
jgi:hypothetical protein